MSGMMGGGNWDVEIGGEIVSRGPWGGAIVNSGTGGACGGGGRIAVGDGGGGSGLLGSSGTETLVTRVRCSTGPSISPRAFISAVINMAWRMMTKANPVM